jgi:hypothetical protein
MKILCFEGPSAVGKSSTAAALVAQGAYVVPEVNVLFERPECESPDWYVERQVDRWRLATEQAEHYRIVVLDGDPFQPLWYNWAYDFSGWQDLNFLEAFYRPRLLSGDIGFPDRYVVFSATVGTLRARKDTDPTKRRRNFETHLEFIHPQRRYFEAMQHFSCERVRFLESNATIEDNMRTVMAETHGARSEQRPVELFDSLIQWLRESQAEHANGADAPPPR